jgi:hypothetical protein
MVLESDHSPQKLRPGMEQLSLVSKIEFSNWCFVGIAWFIVILACFYQFQTLLTLSMLGHMAAIVPRLFSGNFTRSETYAVIQKKFYHTFFTCIA